MFRAKIRHLVCAASVVAMGVPVGAAEAATVNVPCSGGYAALLAAVTSAESTPVADTITLAARCTYAISNDPHNSDFGGNAFPIIRTPITIAGNGATIRRASESRFRFFYVDAPGRLSLRSVTLRGGRPWPGNPGWGGGALFVQAGATVDLQGSTISGNNAGEGQAETGSPGGDGGGIFNAGRLTLTRSTVSGNFGGAGGTGSPGPPAPEGPGNNGAPGGDGGDGGGVYNAGVLSVTGGTVADNSAGPAGRGGMGSPGSPAGAQGERGEWGAGGGIFNFAQMSLSRVTLSANFPENCVGSGCPAG